MRPVLYISRLWVLFLAVALGSLLGLYLYAPTLSAPSPAEDGYVKVRPGALPELWAVLDDGRRTGTTAGKASSVAVTHAAAGSSLPLKDVGSEPSQAVKEETGQSVTTELSPPPKTRGSETSLTLRKVGEQSSLSAEEASMESYVSGRTSSLTKENRSWDVVKATDASSAPDIRSSPFILGNSPPVIPRGVDLHVHRLKNKLVLFYNMPSWFSRSQDTLFKGCPVDACTLTTDKSCLQQAEAVIFHIFLLEDRLPPAPRPPGQVWVAFNLEAPYSLGSNMLTPEWSHSFNWTMTYRVDSDLFAPYGKLVYRGEQKKNYTELAIRKKKSAAWFVSNCHDHSGRLAYVRELQKHYPVDIYGRCGPLKCPRSQESVCFSMLNSTYRFYLAFENSICRDYVTEKFFKVFKPDFHVIPVVRGAADYRNFFPRGTFVDTSDFKSPMAVARYLKGLEAKTETYAAMLREKDKFYAIGARKSAMCRLCGKLHWDVRSHTYPSFATWLSEGVCRTPWDPIWTD